MPLQRMEFQAPPSPWQDILVSALKQYQNSKYELPLKQAMAFSRYTYGMNQYPAQLERIMHDPVALSQLSPTVRDQLAEQYQNYILSHGQGTHNIPSDQETIPQYGPGAQPVAPGQLGKLPTNNYAYDAQGNNIRASQTDIDRAAAPPVATAPIVGTPSADLQGKPEPEGPDSNNPDYSGEMTSQQYRDWVHRKAQAGEFSDGLSPRQQKLEEIIAAKNKLPSYIAAAEEAKKGTGTEITRSTKADDQAHEISLNNQIFSKNLEDFYDSYKKAPIKGGWLDITDTMGPTGKAAIKFLSPKTAEALTKAVQLQVGAANQFFGSATGGRITNLKLNLARDLKLDPHMEPQTVEDNYHSAKSYADRMAQLENFRYNAKQNGFTESEKNAAFGAYLNEAPPYDPKTHKPLQYHQGTEEYYTSPQFLNRLRSKKVLNSNEPPRFLYKGQVYIYKNGKYYMEQ